MSGGITQLVAVGAQDAHLVGNPEISFFHSNYRRHTNFAKLVDRQVIQGNPSANGMSTVRFERKGDLLGHAYITAHNGTSSNAFSSSDWKNAISKVELLVGGQVIDTQTSEFCEELAVDLLAQNLSKSNLGGHHGGTAVSYFYPLRFSCFENWQSALPLVALQYHDVEIRISWGSNLGGNTFECYADFVYLDVNERQSMSAKPQNMLITQVQKAVAPGSKVFDLQFSHPVKFLAMANVAASADFFATNNKMKLQINGVDMADYKYVVPHFTSAASYYSVPYAADNQNRYMVYPFCLDTSKLQPTGSLNFSRLDSARIVSDIADITNDVYAVNYNVLRIENGMGGLMYAN